MVGGISAKRLFRRPKYFLQDGAAVADSVLEILFFFRNDEVQTVKLLASDILLDVGIFFFDKTNAYAFAGQLVVLVGEIDLFCRAGYHQLGCFWQR